MNWTLAFSAILWEHHGQGGEATYGRGEAEQLALAREWRRLTRAATFVAVLTSPVTFALLYEGHDWPLVWALLGTGALVIMPSAASSTSSRTV